MKWFKGYWYVLPFMVIGMLMPVSIVVAGGVALRQARKRMLETRSLSCRADVECPPGFICFNGQCVQAD
jgi:hypothetical protein